LYPNSPTFEEEITFTRSVAIPEAPWRTSTALCAIATSCNSCNNINLKINFVLSEVDFIKLKAYVRASKGCRKRGIAKYCTLEYMQAEAFKRCNGCEKKTFRRLRSRLGPLGGYFPCTFPMHTASASTPVLSKKLRAWTTNKYHTSLGCIV